MEKQRQLLTQQRNELGRYAVQKKQKAIKKRPKKAGGEEYVGEKEPTNSNKAVSACVASWFRPMSRTPVVF
eukprot:m.179730 g.179730  ORF g.179730 m.179730 type:complete len:71 (+) comp16603_c2_seq3:3832-4044(+)